MFSAKYLVLGLLLLTACASGIDDPRVTQFLDIYPDATSTTEKFGVSDSAFVEEFLTQECDAELPFTRTTYEQYGARLTVYEKDDVVVCAISKLEPNTLNLIQGDLETAPEGVALTVNDQPIMFEQVQAVFATLPEEQQTLETINTIIDQLVAQTLLAQEAESYIVDAPAAYAEFLAQANVTEEELVAQFIEQGTTKEAVLAQLEQELKVNALIADKIGTYELDDEAAEDFYLANTDAFIVSEQSVFQQVFINGATRTPEAMISRAEIVLRSLNNTDFCTVVKQYSDDEASKEQCGIYTVPRGVVNPRIEQVVFNTVPGELTAVETETGLHLINVIEIRPATVQRYTDIQDQVKGYVQGQVQQIRLNAYMASLRADAEVVSYLSVQ